MAWIDTIRQQLISQGYSAKNREATEWFMDKLENAAKGGTKSKVLGMNNRAVKTTIMGRMYFFSYDPKYKDTLPYYDRFPLVFPIEEYNDGFLGLNLHYLGNHDRMVLLNRLSAFSSNKRYDETTRIKMDYDTLSGAKKLQMAQPCIKRYLYSHVRSRFIEIPASEWDIAIFLPVQKFVYNKKR